MLNQRPLELIAACMQEVSSAHDIDALMFLIRKTSRKLTSADGVSFVLKDNDLSYYADEDAISPLWKGQRFPMSDCISGWSMINKQTAIINDIYKDDRIPHDLYKATFVKSLAMTPIRKLEPLGAIGCYWANEYNPATDELMYLEILSDIAAVAFERLQLYHYVKDRKCLDMVNSYESADILFSPQRFMDKIHGL